jgi:hypothetical protein
MFAAPYAGRRTAEKTTAAAPAATAVTANGGR